MCKAQISGALKYMDDGSPDFFEPEEPGSF